MYYFATTFAQQLYTDFRNLEIPVVAMINGLRIGRYELAIACNITIATNIANSGQPEIWNSSRERCYSNITSAHWYSESQEAHLHSKLN